jgi:hypothetical protein
MLGRLFHRAMVEGMQALQHAVDVARGRRPVRPELFLVGASWSDRPDTEASIPSRGLQTELGRSQPSTRNGATHPTCSRQWVLVRETSR